MKNNIPELLVPAGGITQLIAAVENGADAVYVGGRLFNARINAANFTNEEMVKAIDYAHVRGVKVFVTMNTLVSDDEMEAALKYAAWLYEMGADALIIQDLGLGDNIHKLMPAMPIHLSTQATCCDAEAVKLALELGYERVVLARELDINEIKTICSETEAEIEVFVHGALCICYSGQCQLSRFYGGRSGNRGQCAQPCRLPWRAESSDEYQLSPRDICMIDSLGELIDAGVTSFKIEGRMKSAEYVAEVTRIYRKYIDMYLASGDYVVSNDDRMALLQIFNRGGFSEGYLHGNPGKDLMSGRIPKNQGIRVGRLAGFRKGSTLVDIQLDKYANLDIGDGVEIYSRDETVGNIISYCKNITGKSSAKALSGFNNEMLRVGDIKWSRLKLDAPVYRTSSKRQLDNIRLSYEGASLDNIDGRKCYRKRPVSFKLEAIGDRLALTATIASESKLIALDENEARLVPSGREARLAPSDNGVSIRVEAGPFEIDRENPTPIARYDQALEKLGGTPFACCVREYEGDFCLRVRAAEINRLRRDLIEKLEKALATRRKAVSVDAFKAGNSINDCAYNYDRPRIALAEICTLDDDELARLDLESKCIFISNVSKGLEDEILKVNYGRCIDIASKFDVYVGNLGWYNRLRFEKVKLNADFGLNAFNSSTVDLLKQFGGDKVIPSLEALDAKELKDYDCMLMVSEHDWSDGTGRNVVLRTKDNKELVVTRKSYSSQSYIKLK